MEDFKNEAYNLAQKFIDNKPYFGTTISPVQAQKITQYGIDNYKLLETELLKLIKDKFETETDIKESREIAKEQIERFASTCMPKLK